MQLKQAAHVQKASMRIQHTRSFFPKYFNKLSVCISILVSKLSPLIHNNSMKAHPRVLFCTFDQNSVLCHTARNCCDPVAFVEFVKFVHFEYRGKTSTHSNCLLAQVWKNKGPNTWTNITNNVRRSCLPTPLC